VYAKFPVFVSELLIHWNQICYSEVENTPYGPSLKRFSWIENYVEYPTAFQIRIRFMRIQIRIRGAASKHLYKRTFGDIKYEYVEIF
jgi:hypothetical protein